MADGTGPRPDLRMEIVSEIGHVSGLLERLEGDAGMLAETRQAFLKLSLLIGEALDIKW